MTEEMPCSCTNPGSQANERILPIRNSSHASYPNLGGFGGIRHGFNNPSRLDRNHYPYPLVSGAAATHFRPQNRGGLPSMNDSLDDFPTGGYRQWRHSIPRQGGIDMIVDDHVQESSRDCPMMTPDQSQNHSLAGQEGPHGLPAASFSVLSMIPDSGHPFNQPGARDGAFISFYSRGSFSGRDNILNSPSPSPPPEEVRRCAECRNHTSTATANPPSSFSQPASLTLPSSPASLSVNSLETIRRSLSIQEQRYFHCITLYNACLDASTFHLSSRRRHHRISSRRYHPYSRPPPYHHSATSQRSISPAPHRRTLMDNISLICTSLWRKARNDGMAPHRAEAHAVCVMKDLYFWAEVVVRAYENEGLDEDIELGEASQSGWGNIEARDGVFVGRMARKLCEWLRDGTARDLCDQVVGQLEDLEEQEDRRELGVESDDGVGIL